jgi:hypothetical protein
VCVCVWCVYVYIGGVRGAGGDKARRCEFCGWRSPTSPPLFSKGMCLICPQIAWSSHVNAFVYMLIYIYLYMYAFFCTVFICDINIKRMCSNACDVLRLIYINLYVCIYYIYYTYIYYIYIYYIYIYVYIYVYIYMLTYTCCAKWCKRKLRIDRCKSAGKTRFIYNI